MFVGTGGPLHWLERIVMGHVMSAGSAPEAQTKSTGRPNWSSTSTATGLLSTLLFQPVTNGRVNVGYVPGKNVGGSVEGRLRSRKTSPGPVTAPLGTVKVAEGAGHACQS